MSAPSTPSIAENISSLRAQIRKACKEASRAPESVELVAVSKFQPEDHVKAALEAGQRVFGENRVQDAQERWTKLRSEWPDVRLHLIGPLQTNKVKDALGLFDVIETVDRPSLVTELAKELAKTPKSVEFLIQVNTGAEDQKSGVAVSELEGLLAQCHEARLNVTGLMCIPPLNEPPALHFSLLKKLAIRHGLPKLSMGMSADYKKAIAVGATHVRVGTAVFGAREA